MTLIFAHAPAGDPTRSSSDVTGRSKTLFFGCCAFMVLFGFPGRSEAQSPPAANPMAEASVLFVHGESPGRDEYESGTYSVSAGLTDPDSGDLYFGNGSASVTVTQNPVSGEILESAPALHAYANASTPGNTEGVLSQATFSDQLNFMYAEPSEDVDDVFFTFHFLISGSLSGTGTGALALNYGSAAQSSPLGQSNTITFALPESELTMYQVVVGGELVNEVGGLFSAQLTAGVINNENGVSGTNIADFSDTVQLQSVDVTDANGNEVQGNFSDGGDLLFTANTPLITAPEPGTISMLISGLALLTIAGLRFGRTGSAAIIPRRRAVEDGKSELF